MKFALIAYMSLALAGPVLAAEEPQDDAAADTSSCARIDQLWQQGERVGLGPLYLGMTATEVERSGHLLFDKVSREGASCGAFSAHFGQDDGEIHVILDSNKRIISLSTDAGEEQCDVRSLASQAKAIFPQLRYQATDANPQGVEASDYTPNYQVGEPALAWLQLRSDAIHLSSEQCHD